MRTPAETEAVNTRAVRRKLRHTAKEMLSGQGSTIDRLVRAWHYLRPLHWNTVPGQSRLNDAQKRELQWILDSMGGGRGAGANSPVIRRLAPQDVEKVATRIRLLASAIQADPEADGTPNPSGTATAYR